MEFGVTFTSRIGDYDLVALAESLGYAQAWFFDSQMIYSDVYATMAVAAQATRRIKLATGVAVPSTRLAPTIAHSIASVGNSRRAALSSAWVTATPPASPWACARCRWAR